MTPTVSFAAPDGCTNTNLCFASGWKWAVPASMRTQIGQAWVRRKVDGVFRMVWVQTDTFSFHNGCIIYDHHAAYTAPAEVALRVRYAVQVVNAVAARDDNEAALDFRWFAMHCGVLRPLVGGLSGCTQREFVRMLREGPTVPHFDRINMEESLPMVFRKSVGETAPIPANATARFRRDTSELLGICRGILADGAVNTNEAQFLLDWINRHAEHRNRYPFSVLYERLSDALADGTLDHDEEASLLSALVAAVGGEADSYGACSLSATLPLNDPLPHMQAAAEFVLTGTFESGSRAAISAMIEHLGGRVADNVRRDTSYLVVGALASPDWANTSHGRKIERAVELREAGHPIAIVPESHWRASFPSASALLTSVR